MFVKSGSITLERLLVSVMSDLSLEFGKRLSLSLTSANGERERFVIRLLKNIEA